jgi:cell wall-associated NlpC family hydrolase
VDDTGTDLHDALGGLGREGLLVAGGLAAAIGLPLVLLIAAVGGVKEGNSPSSNGAATGAVPPEQLVVMQRISRETGIPWQVFAAIAKVESDFGRNMATSSAGAIGYGQFLPATWAGFGRGGDPYDYRDVIPAMARYLLAHGAPGDLRRALYAYNHSWDYVDQVLAVAASYGPGAGGGPGLADTNADGTQLGERVVAIALAQRGKPYVFGATGPHAFDCSGLVQWAFQQVGLAAPRTAQGQYDWAQPVPAATLQAGDLVFFHATSATSSGVDAITHVGIYAGGGQMIVAPQAGTAVRLEALDAPYWRAHFAGAGRVPLPGRPGGPTLA